MKKLDFLIAGVQKSGTTALHHFLRQHHQIFMPKQKELHFFDNESIDWINPDYDSLYHKHFSDALTQNLFGEATPVYTYWQPSMFRIYQYNPSIKIIVVFRDPVARAYSHWRMETTRGTETLHFSEAIRIGRKRVIEQANVNGLNKTYSYVERGFYAEQIERLFYYFQRNQILIMQKKNLEINFQKALNQITSFLNIEEYKEYPEFERIYPFEYDTKINLNEEDIMYLR